MATWNEELAEFIRNNWKIGQTFTLEDIYEHEEHFGRLHPKNHNIKQRLRRTLQLLRDHDIIEFVDDVGTYRRLM